MKLLSPCCFCAGVTGVLLTGFIFFLSSFSSNQWWISLEIILCSLVFLKNVSETEVSMASRKQDDRADGEFLRIQDVSSKASVCPNVLPRQSSCSLCLNSSEHSWNIRPLSPVFPRKSVYKQGTDKPRTTYEIKCQSKYMYHRAHTSSP